MYGNEINDYVLYWEYEDKCYSACSRPGQICPGLNCDKSSRYAQINVNKIGKVTCYECTEPEGYYWSIDNGGDNACHNCPVPPEYWVKVVKVETSGGDKILHLEFPQFWGHGVPFSFKMASINNGLQSAWSNVATCYIEDDPSDILIYPNGGEKICGGSTQSIIWAPENFGTDVIIEYTTGGEPIFEAITENKGIYQWTVPNLNSCFCKVRISDAATGIPSDESNNTFTIYHSNAYISVTCSPEGETLLTGDTYTITWNSEEVGNTVKLQYTNGQTWHEIDYNAPNTGSYYWTIPNDPTRDAKILISSSVGYPTEQSGTFTIINPNAPNYPRDLVANAVSHEQINLTWTDYSDNETGFKIVRKNYYGYFEEVGVVGANVTAYSDTNLEHSKMYIYQILAYNNAGNSLYSNQASATTLLTTAPTKLRATVINANRIDLSWQDNSIDETGFKIERKTGSEPFTFIHTTTANQTYYSDVGLNEKTTYTYRVCAINNEGDTDYTHEVSATTPISLRFNPEKVSDNSILWLYASDLSEENKGADEQLVVGNNYNGPTNRSIIKFDLTGSGLTQRDKITHVSLKLYASWVRNYETRNINVHQILTTWEEMTSCWTRPYNNTAPWYGCAQDDFIARAEPSGSISVVDQSEEWYEWSGVGMVALVQDWINHPAYNQGVLIKLAEDGGLDPKLFQFFSSDYSDPAYRPYLEIAYEEDALYPPSRTEFVAYPTYGEVPLAVHFDGSNCFSPYGIETYSWDFNLSNGITVDATGMRVDHTFNTGGDFIVTLTTIDSAGVSNSDTLMVTMVIPTSTSLHPSNISDNVIHHFHPNDGDEDNLGNYELLLIGNNWNSHMNRSLLKFDIAGLGLTPRDKIISASLKLYMSSLSNYETRNVNLYKILIPWEEMTSCWSRPSTGADPWNGCWPNDVAASAIPSASVSLVDQIGWISWCGTQMTALVQDWISNPANNQGVLIKMEGDGGSDPKIFRFLSSDYSDPAYRPYIEIVYSKDVLYPESKAEIVTYLTYGKAPLTVQFDASNSYSPNGIATYSWDFDASNGISEDATGVQVNNTFNNGGEFLVTLTTTDSTGINKTDTLTVLCIGGNYVAGQINQNTTWQGTIVFFDNVEIVNGATLTIQPGTVIKLNGYYLKATNGNIQWDNSVVFQPHFVRVDNASPIGFYSTIQSAINNASYPQKVYLGLETYSENLVLKMGVDIIGMDKDSTIIDGTVELNGGGVTGYSEVRDLTINKETTVGYAWWPHFINIIAKKPMSFYGGACYIWSSEITYSDSCNYALMLYNTQAEIFDTKIQNGEDQFGIQAENCTYLDMQYSDIKNYYEALYLIVYSYAYVYSSNFCQNIWDASSWSASADFENCVFSGYPWNKLRGDDIYYSNYYICMSKESTPSSSILKTENNSAIETINSSDPGMTDFKEAMRIYREIQKAQKKDAISEKEIKPEKYYADYMKVIEKLKKVVEKHPDQVSAKLALPRIATLYGILNEKQNGLSYLDDLKNKAELNMLKPYVLNASITYALQNNDIETALALSDQFLADYPQHEMAAVVLYGKGIIYKHILKNLTQANAIFNQVISQYPEHRIATSARYELGQTLKDQPNEESEETVEIKEFAVQNYPNPFNPETIIRYTLPQEGRVVLIIYDILGREVRTLIDEERPVGYHTVIWDGKDQRGRLSASGLYIYQIKFRDQVLTKKMLLMR